MKGQLNKKKIKNTEKRRGRKDQEEKSLAMHSRPRTFPQEREEKEIR